MESEDAVKMEWRKIRSFLLVFLLLINLFFIIMVYTAYEAANYLPNSMIADAVANLASRGITIDKAVIERKRPSYDIYTYPSGEQSIASFLDSMKQFLERNDPPSAGKSLDASYFDIPGGITMNLSEVTQDGTAKEFGSITCLEPFGFEYTRAGTAAQAARDQLDLVQTQQLSRGQLTPPSHAHRAVMDQFFSVFSPNEKTDYTAFAIDAFATSTLYGCTLLLDGLPVDGMTMYFYFADDILVAASGNWFYGSCARSYRENLIDGVNILYQLPAETVDTVLDETMVYVPMRIETDRYDLIPCWSVAFTDNSGEIVNTIYDAVTGSQN